MPTSGLVGAGLWEFPSQSVEADSSLEQSRDAMDTYLRETALLPLEPRSVAGRAYLGEIVHIFSHIRMVLRVERIQLRVGANHTQEAIASVLALPPSGRLMKGHRCRCGPLLRCLVHSPPRAGSRFTHHLNSKP
jgi:hypothetical protein